MPVVSVVAWAEVSAEAPVVADGEPAAGAGGGALVVPGPVVLGVALAGGGEAGVVALVVAGVLGWAAGEGLGAGLPDCAKVGPARARAAARAA
jgi:hypothetical protein